MQKKFYLFAISLVFGALLMASCSSSSSGVSSYVPDNALGVACLNFKSIAEKGELDNLKNMAIVKEMRNELRYESTEIDNMVGQLMDDPASCGLDLREDIVMALCEYRDDAMLELVAKMHNESDFKDLLRKVYSGNMIREADNFSYIEDNDMVIAWDKKVALLLVFDGSDINMRDEAKRILTLSKDRSIASNENFTKFWSNRGDVSLYVDFSNILRVPELRREFRDVPTAFMDGLEKAACYGTLNFDKGNIALRVEALNFDYYKQVFNQDFNADLLNYTPDKALAAATLSVNIQALTDMIREMDARALKEELTEEYTIGDVLNCFNGSIAASISDLNEGDWGYEPVFTITADLSNSSKMKRILDEMKVTDEAESGNGYYKVDGLYFAVKNDVLIVTNDIINLNAHGNGMRDVADDAKSGFFAYVDLNINNYPSSIKNNLSNDTRNFLKSMCTTCVLKKDGNNAAKVTISIPSGSQNSLAYLFKLIDSYLYKLEDIADDIDKVMYPGYYEYPEEVVIEEPVIEEPVAEEDYYYY